MPTAVYVALLSVPVAVERGRTDTRRIAATGNAVHDGPRCGPTVLGVARSADVVTGPLLTRGPVRG